MSRLTRPTRKRLEALIVEHGGNMSRVADVLAISRQTLYTWTYQLDLTDRAGIRAEPLPPATCERRNVTIRISQELWRWVRIEAINRDTPVGVIVEEALRGLRAAATGETSAPAREAR